MEQLFTQTDNPTITPEKQKKSKGMLIGLVSCTALASVGIGFGIYAMMQNQTKETQISDLKVQIENNDGTTTVIDTPKVETTEKDGTTVTIVDSPKREENTEEYIWIGAWGLKIKIPSLLKGVAYTFNNYGDLCVSGVKYVEGMQYAPEFAMIDKNAPGLACVSRDSQREETHVSFGEHSYSITGSQAVFSTDEEEVNWEMNSRALVIEMLSSVENYSEI